jgi:tyrosinase
MHSCTKIVAILLASFVCAVRFPLERRALPTCCTNHTTTRVDYGSMPSSERQEYVSAIQCMMGLPSQLDQTEYPAAISRYFDYAVIHVRQSQQIHNSGFFLTWHRYFLAIFENDLRTLCSYTGRFPYWNFASTSSLSTLTLSPVFDGTPSSLSGDGLPTNLTSPIVLGPNLTLPHGTGGGCVTTGPFANLTVPMAYISPNYLRNGTLPATAFAYQPNCLRRDLNPSIARLYTSPTNITSALETALNGLLGGGTLGIHSGAHFSVGGAVGQLSSIHVSPQDPVWFAMHTFVDLVYDSWRKRNPEVAEQVSGTGTAGNVPPSEAVTAESVLPDFGYLEDGEVRVGELFETNGEGGRLCYEYDVVLS